MSILKQLAPPLAMITPLGEAAAHFALVNGADLALFGVFQLTTGENWWFDNRFIRLLPSITGERYSTSDIYLPPEMREKLRPHFGRHGISIS